MEHLNDDQRITLTFGQLLRLVREASSANEVEACHDGAMVDEGGGTAPGKIEEARLKYVMDELLTNTLTNARRGRQEVTSAKQIGYGVIVCDVHKQQKPYDIVVQWVKNGELRTARIEDKSTEQSSMFEKVFQFTFKRRSNEISGIDFSKINSATEQSPQDIQNWNTMFSSVSSEVKRQLNKSIRDIISNYNNLVSSYETSGGTEMRFGDDSFGTFNKDVMDKVIKGIDSTLTEPFDFSIDMLCRHYKETDYLHIGSSFLRFSDDNPLNLKMVPKQKPNQKQKSEARPPSKVDEIFKNAKAKFQIRKRKGQYVIILHVYGLVRREDELSQMRSDIEADNSTNSDSVVESDDDGSESSFTLDELIHQQPS